MKNNLKNDSKNPLVQQSPIVQASNVGITAQAITQNSKKEKEKDINTVDKFDAFDKNQSILAIIDQKQKIRNGDKIQVRLLQDTNYRGLWIPQNTILYGLCSINQNRLKIQIPSITVENHVFKSNLNVYDMDGIQGIYIDGTHAGFTRDLIKEGLTSSTGLGVRNPIGNFSIRLGRKASNNNKVYVPTGYQVMLFDASI